MDTMRGLRNVDELAGFHHVVAQSFRNLVLNENLVAGGNHDNRYLKLRQSLTGLHLVRRAHDPIDPFVGSAADTQFGSQAVQRFILEDPIDTPAAVAIGVRREFVWIPGPEAGKILFALSGANGSARDIPAKP